MKKKLLSLALALTICLSLTVPAFAAGTKEVVIDETHGVRITMDEVLRVETNRYPGYVKLTIYVVADNSTVTVEALDGYTYAPEDYSEDDWFEGTGRNDKWAWQGGHIGYSWTGDGFGVGGGIELPLTGPVTETVSPSGGALVSCDYSVSWLCESDFARLVPANDVEIQAADWAKETLEDAYDAGLFNRTSINPFTEDCTRGMTRAEFAAATVSLYDTLGGFGSIFGVDSTHPFTDVSQYSDVGYAYNLGIVTGTSKTTFSPDATLTREQAAVMLARVYTKLYGDIPAVTATSFADDSSVSSWAKSSVAFMADKGIIKGVGENKFAPQNTLSIQEAVIMAQRMLENLG